MVVLHNVMVLKWLIYTTAVIIFNNDLKIVSLQFCAYYRIILNAHMDYELRFFKLRKCVAMCF